MSRGMPLEAVAHASAAEDHALVAQLLDQHHQPLLAGGAGSGRMLLRWVGTLPDDCLAEYPRLAVAAVLAAILAGSTVEQRRYLRVADQANAAQAPHPDPYVTTWALAARAVTISGGVRQAVLDGRRAVELAQESHESAVASALTSALVASARSLFLAGALDEASATALRALEQPDIDRRAPTRAVAHATVALVAVEQRRLASARSHAEKAKEAVARIRSGRSWLGAHACAALGAVLAAEGDLAAAEQELATGEHFFRDEVTTLDRTWLLVLLAGVRVRRGRLDEAAATLGAALEALDELGDSGRVPQLADEVARELERAMTRAQSGELAERPTEAELSVLRLMAADFSMREIGDQLFLSHNTIRSHRHNLYRKLGVHSRPDALARAAAFGLLTQPDSPG